MYHPPPPDPPPPVEKVRCWFLDQSNIGQHRALGQCTPSMEKCILFIFRSKQYWQTLDPWAIYPHPRRKLFVSLFLDQSNIGQHNNKSYAMIKTEQKVKYLG